MDIIFQFTKTFWLRICISLALIYLGNSHIQAFSFTGVWLGSQIALSQPVSSFGSSRNTNIIGIFSKLLQSNAEDLQRVQGGLLLPAETGFQCALQAHGYIVNGFGFSGYMAYSRYAQDPSVVQIPSQELFNLLSGPLPGSIAGFQPMGNSLSIFNNISLESKTQSGHYQLSHFYAGAGFEYVWGLFSARIRLQPGVSYFNTTETGMEVLAKAGFFSIPLFTFKQSALQKLFFGLNSGIDFGMQLRARWRFVWSYDYLWVPDQTLNSQIQITSPLASVLGSSESSVLQNLPTAVRVQYSLGVQNWNTQVGLAYRIASPKPPKTHE